MNIALIFSGGTGTRMNSKSKPKQFLELNCKPIIIHTIEHFENHSEIDAIAVVCHEDWIDYLKRLIEKYNIKKVKWIVKGGPTGQSSIRNGLYAIANDYVNLNDIIVLIHDGVRPLINEAVISDCIKVTKQYGNAITVAPVFETVVKTDENNHLQTVFDRSKCRLARAPQCFILKDIIEAHKRLIKDGDPQMIDSAMLMTSYGAKLNMVNGPIENIKITTPVDFYIFRSIIEAKENSQIWGL